MDGGRRHLQPIMAMRNMLSYMARASARSNRLATDPTASNSGSPLNMPSSIERMSDSRRSSRRAARPPRGFSGHLLQIASRKGLGIALTVVFCAATAAYAARQGGAYKEFIARHGELRDILARGAGFNIAAITINGQRELLSTEVLAIAGIRTQDSLLFLDLDAVRERLQAEPIISKASVRKLFPDQIVITIKERHADAIWQKGDDLYVVSQTGQIIDKMRDKRFARLPFVVGPGADKKVAEYFSILTAAGPLRSKIRAGVLAAKRRWTIKFKNGLDLKLPGQSPERSMAFFASLALKHDLLEKNLLSVDMRVPGRLIARLAADASPKGAHKGSRKKPAKQVKSRRKGAPA